MEGNDQGTSSSAKQSSRAEIPEAVPIVAYRIDWKTSFSAKGTRSFRMTKPHESLNAYTNKEESSKFARAGGRGRPAVEIVTIIRAWATSKDGIPIDSKSDDSESSEEGDERDGRIPVRRQPSIASTSSKTRRSRTDGKIDVHSISLDQLKIKEVLETKLVIHSQHLLDLIRQCVTYYPGQSLTGRTVEFHEPYPALIHHLKEFEGKIQEEHGDYLPCKSLEKLVEYLKEYMQTGISPALERLQATQPMVAHKDLWILFKPGQNVYYGKDIVGIVLKAMHGVRILPRGRQKRRDRDSDSDSDADLPEPIPINTPKVRLSHSSPEPPEFHVAFWTLSYTGTKLQRQCVEVVIDVYEGERSVTLLPVFPCSYLDNKDGRNTSQTLIERGQKIYHLYRQMPKHVFYDGLIKVGDASSKYRGYCILDGEGAFERRPALSQKFWQDQSRVKLQVIEPYSPWGDMLDPSVSEFAFTDFTDITVAASEDLPTDRHYLILAPILLGLAIELNEFVSFELDSILGLPHSEGINNIFIDPDNHGIVKAITYRHSASIQIDEIDGKGKGQVVLLHGPPGVGKTYTVECIARSTERPLFAISMGNIIETSRYSTSLKSGFQWVLRYAKRCGAIVLLDEADILLEQRAPRDIERNQIVSEILHRLEYFDGLLFLTTNRVGQIDDAILSRISVVLQYDNLTNDTRKKIWQAFFKKVKEDFRHAGEQTVEIGKYAGQYIMNDPEVQELQWNGREIRNTLQTAISLAIYRCMKEQPSPDSTVLVDEDDFRSVVVMSRKFKIYMKGIANLNEDERAQIRYDRGAH